MRITDKDSSNGGFLQDSHTSSPPCRIFAHQQTSSPLSADAGLVPPPGPAGPWVDGVYAWTSLRCLFRPCKLEKPLKQDWTKPFSQMLHLKGLSPVWYLLWIFNSAEDLKDFSQSSHLKGRSPVWIRMCLTSASLPKNPFPQCSQGKRRPLWWKLSCFRRHLLDVNVFPHWAQVKVGKGFSDMGSPVLWTRCTCLVSVTPCLNFLPHSQHR
uniref:Uncharacterized protein n=1 Tax=Cynoglossus semilaevis TaxID=244447 RepID=A0A3P8UPJ7_CYNSE